MDTSARRRRGRGGGVSRAGVDEQRLGRTCRYLQAVFEECGIPGGIQRRLMLPAIFALLIYVIACVCARCRARVLRRDAFECILIEFDLIWFGLVLFCFILF